MAAIIINRICSGLINTALSVPNLMAGEPHYRSLVVGLDQQAITEIIGRYAQDKTFQDGRKYLQLGWYLRDSMARAVSLDLHRTGSLRVLDLGSGAGYFLLACRHFEHSGLGFDLPDNPFYMDMFRHLQLARVEGSVQPFTPLPGIEGQFDLITAFSVTFAKSGRSSGGGDWSKKEWHYFLADMRRLLRPGGRLHLRLNIPDVSGLQDAKKYDYFHGPIDGYTTKILNRREICLYASQ